MSHLHTHDRILFFLAVLKRCCNSVLTNDMNTFSPTDVFRYTDLPAELQMKVLEKYFEGIAATFYEDVVHPERTVVHEKLVDGIKLCSFETIRPKTIAPKMVSREVDNVVNLMLVSRNFKLQAMNALRVQYAANKPWSDLARDRRSGFDPSVDTTEIELDFSDWGILRARFKNLRFAILNYWLSDYGDHMAVDDLRSEDLNDIYSGKLDANFLRWVLSDLERIMCRADLKLAEILREGITICWKIHFDLSIYCNSCGWCPFDFRRLVFYIDIDSSGCRIESIEVWETDECVISYDGEEPEFESLVNLYNEKIAGNLELWAKVRDRWYIDNGWSDDEV